MAEEDGDNVVGAIGNIVIFSFVSVMFIFFAMMLIGGFNNYILLDLLTLINNLIGINLIPTFFGPTADATASNFIKIIPYIDILWFGAFISFSISSLIFSYNRARENYFSLFTMSVLGLIVITYVGSFFIQMTEWFNEEILLAVFPNLVNTAPIFSWYLSHLAIINLVLISVTIILNFVDLDFSKFNRRKEDESFEEL